MKQKIRNVVFTVSDERLKNNRLFDVNAARDGMLERYALLKEALESIGIQCSTIDMVEAKDIDVLIFENIANDIAWIIKTIGANDSVMLINIPLEPPIISKFHEVQVLENMPFDRIYTWNDDLVNRCDCAAKMNVGEKVIDPESIPRIPCNERKFICCISGNKLVKHPSELYSERLRALDYFSLSREGIDLFGVGWETSTRTSVINSLRGPVENKSEVLKSYKFSICYENSKEYNGYISEKIFDCFAAGTVPIYYGAPNIQKYIPKECFIDYRDFGSYERLYKYLKNMSEIEFKAYLEQARSFILSPKYYQFTSECFADTVVKEVEKLSSDNIVKKNVMSFKISLIRGVLARPFGLPNLMRRYKRFFFYMVTIWK